MHNKHNKYVITQKLENFGDINFRDLSLLKSELFYQSYVIK